MHASRVRALLSPLWQASAPLTAASLATLPVLAACLLGLWLDPRTVLGAPVWLKPAKFAASIALYGLTLSWILSLLSQHARTRRIVSWSSASVLVLELGIICAQAARGTSSHFNAATPLDRVLYSLMGLAIVGQTLVSVLVAVALWRERLADAPLRWALRLGMVVTIAGAFLGGVMTRPTQAQLAKLRAGAPVSAIGAHTVGAADGGPGLPGTGWSREHGDLRVAHFAGLHALQVLPLLALGLRRTRRSEPERVRLVKVAAASYATLVALLLLQALRGQSLLSPDAITGLGLASWLGASGLAAAWAQGWRLRWPRLGSERQLAQAASPRNT